MKTAKIKSPKLKIIIAVVFAILLVGGGYWLVSRKIAYAPSGTDRTSDWKTYTNARYKYSIKYPPEFSIPEYIDSESYTLAIIVKEGNAYTEQFILIGVEENPDRLSFRGWLESPAIQEASIFEPSTFSEAVTGLRIAEEVFGELTWLTFKESEIPLGFPPWGEARWALMKEDKVFLIGFLNLSLEKDGPVVEQILSTFKFFGEEEGD